MGTSTLWVGNDGAVGVGTTTPSAAKLCRDYTNTDTGTGVYSDWYLPSRDELDLMYRQRFIINKTFSAGGGFASGGCWSSTEGGNGYAWFQYFDVGDQSNASKYVTYYVRAVRAF